MQTRKRKPKNARRAQYTQPKKTKTTTTATKKMSNSLPMPWPLAIIFARSISRFQRPISNVLDGFIRVGASAIYHTETNSRAKTKQRRTTQNRNLLYMQHENSCIWIIIIISFRQADWNLYTHFWDTITRGVADSRGTWTGLQCMWTNRSSREDVLIFDSTGRCWWPWSICQKPVANSCT